jgi:hypothetical protein
MTSISSLPTLRHDHACRKKPKNYTGKAGPQLLPFLDSSCVDLLLDLANPRQQFRIIAYGTKQLVKLVRLQPLTSSGPDHFVIGFPHELVCLRRLPQGSEVPLEVAKDLIDFLKCKGKPLQYLVADIYARFGF